MTASDNKEIKVIEMAGEHVSNKERECLGNACLSKITILI